MKNKITNLSWGLYNVSFRNPFVWLKYAIKDTLILFKRVGFLLQHGYGEAARWETDYYLIDMFEDIFKWKRYERMGNIPFEGGDEEIWGQMNDDFYDGLLFLLEDMRSEDCDVANAAKDEFFGIIKEYYFHLWD